MTGKEALNNLIEELKWCCNDGKELTDYDKSMIEPIQRDLEILEIIKEKCLTNCNLALVKDNRNYQNYCKEFEYFLNKYNESPNGFEITKEDLLIKEEFNLIKEWLNNEI